MFRSRLILLVVTLVTASAAACGFATSGIPEASSGSGAAPGSGGSQGAGSAPGTGGTGSAAAACASEDCETIPAGWTLVRARRTDQSSPADASAPACSGGAAPAVYYYGPNDAACGPCSCGQPTGFSCSAPQLTCSYSTLTCQGADLQVQDDSDGACSFHWPPAFGNSNGSCSLTAPPHVTSKGTCDAQGGGVTPKDPFKGTVVVCPATAGEGGCGAGRSCIPAGATVDGAVCITRADATPCPAGWTTDTTPAFEAGFDTRACAACACDVQCEGGYYVAWGDDTCGGSSVEVATTTCVQVPNIFSWSMASVQAHVGAPKLGSCTPAAPSGMVAATDVHQICCK